MSLSSEEKTQYSRHLLLYEIGEVGQLKLKQSKVLVIGAGGLGCPVLQYLTAAGIGTIGVIDHDVVEQSNLQRQILFTIADIGLSKAECAVKRLRLLNPFINFTSYSKKLSIDNAIKLFENYDIIVDGTDNFPTRYLINDAAVITNKPIVFGSILKFEGQVSVLNFKNGPTYRCLFPVSPKPNEVPNCTDIGVLGILPGIIGSLQANEVLKIVLGLGMVLSGKLLTFNALSMKQQVFSFEKNPSMVINALEENYQAFCGIPNAIQEISYQEYIEQSSNFNVLDVRNQIERNEFHISSIHIPLDELSQRLHEIPDNKSLLVFCKSGLRSKLAVNKLLNEGFKNKVMGLKGGLSSDLYQNNK
ncbi:dinucleotide-utilizing protein [Bizionia argentinensis JUB59]|uniref:Molybdopterin-synthase adenylyltransferase n=1 Tax=Bizionia argentinensis JUB59 TaxID=1046627 RepID=G2EB32_9FLAO|nr:HesA/MoeB/ThiF family protein [Bizionia argentinensis]EGV44372.1 dinucleotide-utilizing protein [Bizionia argentinensis JUB59]